MTQQILLPTLQDMSRYFLNGVLLSRGSDYTATTGTSVVLSVATITSDIVEIIAALQVAYTDTITTAAAATTYVAKALTTTTGDIIYASAANTPARLGIGSSAQVLTVASGIPSWATPASAGGTWAAWTPTLTNLTLGNGTLTSRYAAVGQIVNFSFFFTFGSTSSMGTNPSISWPVTPASTAAAKAAQIHVWNQDVSSQANLATAHPYARTTSVFILHTITSSATTSTEADVTVTATAPFTWTTGDLIWISGTYESV